MLERARPYLKNVGMAVIKAPATLIVGAADVITVAGNKIGETAQSLGQVATAIATGPAKDNGKTRSVKEA